MENLQLAYQKAKRGKSRKASVIEFTENLNVNLNALHEELSNQTYKPRPLRRFIIRDPKTRTIHAAHFCDRLVHHALINLLEPIFEPRFIYDCHASRKGKGTLRAIQRFDEFLREVTNGGKLIHEPHSENNIVGYVFKADVKHFFDTVDHATLMSIIASKVADKKILWLIKQILDNFKGDVKGLGMPLGNFTSQFFANIYLTRLDYFVKHVLKAKYYIRYVDDLVILHRNKAILQEYARKINLYLKHLKLELHPDKSAIHALRNGVTFLGYRVFYHNKLLRKRNIRHYMRKFKNYELLHKNGQLSEEDFLEKLQGWFGYAQWANTFKLRENLKKRTSIGGGANADFVIYFENTRNELFIYFWNLLTYKEFAENFHPLTNFSVNI